MKQYIAPSASQGIRPATPFKHYVASESQDINPATSSEQ